VSTPTQTASEPIFSVPNLLTLVRLPLAALLWVRPEDATFTLSVMAAAAVSDAVDGRFARAMRRRAARRRGEDTTGDGSSAVGAWLDPACDKTFVVSAVLAVSWAVQPPLGVIALIAVRELGVLPLAFLYRLLWRGRRLRFDFRAGPLGKATTVSQFAAIASMLVAPALMWPIAIFCGTTGALAIADYFRRGWRMGRSEDASETSRDEAASS
jgi:phosphatidylglycerophosphate synthase